jgi:hypothetical protein
MIRWLPMLSLQGCATFAFAGHGTAIGFVYTDATTPQHVTDNVLGKKKGEACATSILGWVTTGDASIRAAADAGGIKEISAIDSSFKNILGVYATYCTVVSGTG